MQDMLVPTLDWENPQEKEMTIQFNILAWEIPRIEKPGGSQSVGHKRVTRDLATKQQQ